MKSLLEFLTLNRINNIPRSKISSAAIGSEFQIQGKIFDTGEEIIAPITQISCCAFIWDLEMLSYGTNSPRWLTVSSFYSRPYIYVNDGSNELAAVDLTACNFQDNVKSKKLSFSNEFSFKTGKFHIPLLVQEYLSKYSMVPLDDGEYKNVEQFRIYERVLLKNENIQVVGSTIPIPSAEVSIEIKPKQIVGTPTLKKHNFREKVAQVFNKIKRDPATIAKYDQDQNHSLSHEELMKLHQDIQNEVSKEFDSSLEINYLKKSKFLISTDEQSLSPTKLLQVHISTGSQSKLKLNMGITATTGLLLGSLIMGIGIYLFLQF